MIYEFINNKKRFKLVSKGLIITFFLVLFIVFGLRAEAQETDFTIQYLQTITSECEKYYTEVETDKCVARVRAIMKLESSVGTEAISTTGAIGLGQFIDSVGTAYKVGSGDAIPIFNTIKTPFILNIYL